MFSMAAEDSFTFIQNDLAETLFPVFEDIKKMNKLCDVTLKVHFHIKIKFSY